ncbi:MAG: 16S rRNA (cytosine(1402)-N(4))-methyltransferase RsmH [Pseudomonadota bacterium]
MSDQAAPHFPVMLPQVLETLAPRPGETIVDGTFGAGGYSRAILKTGASVIGFDRDPTAIENGQSLVDEFDGRLRLIETPFAEMRSALANHGVEQTDGVVLDVGVSSMQIDQAERGFSFQQDGPLDMRMGSAGVTAADVVNTAAPADLVRILGILGEERQAKRIVRAIVARREDTPFTRTRDLATAIANAAPGSPQMRIHPATRSFQALRMFVNGELEQLAGALQAATALLSPGGRLVVVSFHSLEDRLVKRFFQSATAQGGGSRHMPETTAEQPLYEMISKGAMKPTEEEIAINARSRSARLRAGRRTDAESRVIGAAKLGLPDWSGVKLHPRGDRA